MASSTRPKVGVGSIAVSRSYGIHITRSSCPTPSQGLSTDPIQVESIEVFPNPPKPGQNLTVIVEASTQERVQVRLRVPVPYGLH